MIKRHKRQSLFVVYCVFPITRRLASYITWRKQPHSLKGSTAKNISTLANSYSKLTCIVLSICVTTVHYTNALHSTTNLFLPNSKKWKTEQYNTIPLPKIYSSVPYHTIAACAVSSSWKELSWSQQILKADRQISSSLPIDELA